MAERQPRLPASAVAQGHAAATSADDDTVRVRPGAAPQKPPLITSRRAWLAGAGILGTACVLRGAAWLLEQPKPVPKVATAPTSPQATPTAPAPAAPTSEFVIQRGTEQEILHHASPGLTVFSFADDQRILVLDFASLFQQGTMLNRVAALIEKAGTPRTRVLTDEELHAAIVRGGDTVGTYYYGHDYSASGLQQFFQLAAADRVALNEEEQKLQRLLQQVGWMQPGAKGGLISIPAVGANANITLTARAAILHHELAHGLFFSDPDYAAFVHRFWLESLTEEERGSVRRFLGSEGYDTSLEELMYNEMQAYLMFTRDPQFFAPARIGMTTRRLAELQTQFLRGMPTGWLHDSLMATPVVVTAADQVR